MACKLAALGDPFGDPGLIELGVLEMNHHQDHLISQDLGLGPQSRSTWI